MSEEGPTEDSLRGRAGESRTKLWVLVEADRRLVAGLLAGTTFLALVVVGGLSPDATALIREGDPVETAFQALVGATVTGVTLVLTINQLVLSQELGSVGDQRERMADAMAFRADVADLLDDPAPPPEPAAFLRAVLGAIGDRADALQAAVPEGDDAEGSDADADLADEVATLADAVTENADDVSGELETAQFGTFGVVSAALDFDYSRKIYAARRIHGRYALPDDAADAVDDLLDALQTFATTREHFKTLYFQWELVDLSRAIVATTIPALVVAVSTLVFYRPGSLSGSLLSIPVAVLAVAAATTLSLLPFWVLLAYILRIATVGKRTLSIGPFTLRPTDRSADVDEE